jgi:hypothetical protein
VPLDSSCGHGNLRFEGVKNRDYEAADLWLTNCPSL